MATQRIYAVSAKTTRVGESLSRMVRAAKLSTVTTRIERHGAVAGQVDYNDRPCAWQWLNTAVLRKKLPKTADAGAWGPLYDKATLDAAVTSERERLAARFDGSADIERLRAAPAWWRCDTHGEALPHNAWGCPDCVRELRGEVKVLRTVLDKIAEHTRSGDPCHALVQIARDALRINARGKPRR